MKEKELVVPPPSVWTSCFLNYMEYKLTKQTQPHKYLKYDLTYEEYLEDWYNDFCND